MVISHEYGGMWTRVSHVASSGNLGVEGGDSECKSHLLTAGPLFRFASSLLLGGSHTQPP